MTLRLTDELMTLREATKNVPGRSPGKRISPTTVHRWARYGIRGVRLETVYIGGCRYTTTAALERFFERVAAASLGQRESSRADAHTAPSGRVASASPAQ